MNRLTQRNRYVIGALFLTFALYFIFSISGWIYTYTDNITVAVVTAGYYGDNNMCQYLHPLLCLIIKGLNPLLPTADVFALLTHLALAAGVFLISYAVIEKAFRRPLRDWKAEDFVNAAVPLLSICYFSLGLKLFGVNYTVQTDHRRDRACICSASWKAGGMSVVFTFPYLGTAYRVCPIKRPDHLRKTDQAVYFAFSGCDRHAFGD